MELDPQLARDWIDAARSLQATMERFPPRTGGEVGPGVATSAGNITIRVEDGKTPRMMLIAAFSAALCAVLFAIAVPVGVTLYLNMKDHLDAIYMMAPQLQQGIDHEHHHPDAAPEEAERKRPDDGGRPVDR